MTARLSTILFFAALLFAAAMPACAESSADHPLLQEFKKAGGTVEYLGSAHGLDTWLVTNPKGEKQTAYITSDGAMIAAGVMFEPDGKNVTEQQLKQYHEKIANGQAALPAADATSKPEKLYAQAEKSGWVSLGDAQAPYLYLFMNVNCEHCQAFWKELEAPVRQGKLQVRIIPYGKAEANRDGGAALLSAADPTAAWEAYVGGDKSVLSKDKAKPESYTQVDSNTDLVNAWSLPGPPFSLYRRPADGKLTALAGKPENTMLLLAEFLK